MWTYGENCLPIRRYETVMWLNSKQFFQGRLQIKHTAFTKGRILEMLRSPVIAPPGTALKRARDCSTLIVSLHQCYQVRWRLQHWPLKGGGAEVIFSWISDEVHWQSAAASLVKCGWWDTKTVLWKLVSSLVFLFMLSVCFRSPNVFACDCWANNADMLCHETNNCIAPRVQDRLRTCERRT